MCIHRSGTSRRAARKQIWPTSRQMRGDAECKRWVGPSYCLPAQYALINEVMWVCCE